MLLLTLFLSITYLCCSFQFVEFFINNKKHSKLCENTISKIVKFAKQTKFVQVANVVKCAKLVK